MKTTSRPKADRKFRWFTLVELVVVITILAILATVGFLRIAGFSSSARDGDRLTTLKNVELGLSLFKVTAGTYPMPEADGPSGVSTGSIGGVTYAYRGTIGDATARIAKLNKVPVDPLSKTGYTYAVSGDRKHYQVAAVLENALSYGGASPGIVPAAYADSASPYRAKVHGNYPGYMKFSDASWSLWLANVPSLIWNNAGPASLLSGWTYFVVDNQANLPYGLGGAVAVQTKDGNQMVQAITGTGAATLTGVSLSGVTTQAGVSALFTGSLLASFGGKIESVTAMAIGNAPAGSAPAAPAALSCSGGYHAEGNACVGDAKNVACGGSNPGTAASSLGTATADIAWNGSAWNATPNWSHVTGAPGICQYQCKAGYWYDGGACVAAGAGYYVAGAGATSQSQCTAGYYCTGGSVSATQNDCPANSWCALGSGSPTACAGGTTSLARSASAGACTAPPPWLSFNIATKNTNQGNMFANKYLWIVYHQNKCMFQCNYCDWCNGWAWSWGCGTNYGWWSGCPSINGNPWEYEVNATAYVSWTNYTYRCYTQ